MTRRFSETIVIGILHHLEPDQIYALNPSKFLKIYPELRKLYLMGRILAETSYANNSNFCRYLEKPYEPLECSPTSYATSDYTCAHGHGYESSNKRDHSKALKLHTLTDVKNTLPKVFNQTLVEANETIEFNYDRSYITLPPNTLIMGCFLEADTAEHLQDVLTKISYIRLNIGAHYHVFKFDFSTFGNSNNYIKKITDTKISIFSDFLKGFPNIDKCAQVQFTFDNYFVGTLPFRLIYTYYDLTLTKELFQRFDYERLISQTYPHDLVSIISPTTIIRIMHVNTCVSRMRFKFVNLGSQVPAITIKKLQLNIDGRFYDYTNLLTVTDDGYDLLKFQTHDMKQLKFINFSLIDIDLILEIEDSHDNLHLAMTYDYWNLVQFSTMHNREKNTHLLCCT